MEPLEEEQEICRRYDHNWGKIYLCAWSQRCLKMLYKSNCGIKKPWNGEVTTISPVCNPLLCLLGSYCIRNQTQISKAIIITVVRYKQTHTCNNNIIYPREPSACIAIAVVGNLLSQEQWLMVKGDMFSLVHG